MTGFFGIDFGTTNSTAVKLMGGDFHKYGDEAGQPLPSIVALDRATGEASCGREVWQNREEYRTTGAVHVIESIKLQMGSDLRWPTEVGVWTPEDVAAVVLKQLSTRAKQLGLEAIDEAVISIPVDYPAESRRALRRAAAKAGIQIKTFITESTAALVRHFDRLQHCRYVAVFDWGGGTLDISVLEIRDGRVFELSTEGMDIAGDAIDKDFAQAIHARVMEERREKLAFISMPSVDQDNLRTKCELAKWQFSKLPVTDILLSAYGGSPLSINVQRDWFESLISPHVDLAIELLTRAIQKAGVSFDAIDRLLVIGGSSQLRLLHAKLRNDQRFAASFQSSPDAEWDCAAGAAIIARAPGSHEIAESIGILLSDNSFYELIREGEAVLSEARTVSLSLVEDAQQANVILAKRLDGQRHVTSPESIVEFGVETAGFDLECIDLRYSIDPDLVLKVDASSRALGVREVAREYGKLRFAYRVPSQ
jgi:molecular chaperone DnaK